MATMKPSRKTQKISLLSFAQEDTSTSCMEIWIIMSARKTSSDSTKRIVRS